MQYLTTYFSRDCLVIDEWLSFTFSHLHTWYVPNFIPVYCKKRQYVKSRHFESQYQFLYLYYITITRQKALS